MQNEDFCETFRLQNGIPYLVKVIEKSQGNLLAYCLKALENYIRSLGNLSFIRTTLMKKLCDSLFVNELNVVRPALNILALMTDPEAPLATTQGAFLYLLR
jgi:hypothetical protein